MNTKKSEPKKVSHRQQAIIRIAQTISSEINEVNGKSFNKMKFNKDEQFTPFVAQSNLNAILINHISELKADMNVTQQRLDMITKTLNLLLKELELEGTKNEQASNNEG